MIDIQFVFVALVEILKSLPLTLLITIVPLIIGFGIGTVVALVRMNKVRVLSPIADFYVSFVRGTPLMLHIYIIYYGLPRLFDLAADRWDWSFQSNSIPLLTFIFVAFSFNAGAYMSEIIRSGILSVSRGEIEAAFSVGMTYFQTIRRIVLPQAVAVSLPNLCNTFIALLHGSALAFWISIIEMTGKANLIASHNYRFLESFLVAALIYWAISIVSEQITARLEKRLLRYRKNAVA